MPSHIKDWVMSTASPPHSRSPTRSGRPRVAADRSPSRSPSPHRSRRAAQSAGLASSSRRRSHSPVGVGHVTHHPRSTYCLKDTNVEPSPPTHSYPTTGLAASQAHTGAEASPPPCHPHTSPGSGVYPAPSTAVPCHPRPSRAIHAHPHHPRAFRAFHAHPQLAASIPRHPRLYPSRAAHIRLARHPRPSRALHAHPALPTAVSRIPRPYHTRPAHRRRVVWLALWLGEPGDGAPWPWPSAECADERGE
ncbi:hypothetical protein PLICRDRAFT_170697 [Plicaturopsis crispa FD-325 SS-3]|nr:hypothetical protein PLICRDRAFT_170697 [Plicaturopsis crispa FD-325 SS-3]